MQPESSAAAAGAVPCAASRLCQFSSEFKALKEAAIGVLETLCPEAPIPPALHELASRLDGASIGIDEQLEMAARGGRDMSLALVKFWYPQVQVGMLADGFRTGTSLEGLRPEIHMASERIAKAADLTQLVPAKPSSAMRLAGGSQTGDSTAASDVAPP